MRTIVINNPGPQGSTGPQGVAGPSGSTQPFNNVSGSIWATTSSLQVSGSFLVSGSSTFTNIGPAIFSGSAIITGATTMSSAIVLGDVTVLGTASINVLQINTTINSTGSNTLGDNANDIQTLYGTVVIPTGSLTVSGSTQVNGTLTIKRSTAGNLIEFRNQSDNILVGGIQHVSDGGLAILGGPGNQYFNNSVQIGATPNTITFSTAGTGEKMRITGSNVLIGTTTDTGLYKFDVNGNSRINGQLVCGTINPGTTANIAGMTVYQGTIDPSTNYDMRLVIPTATKGVIVSQDYSFLSSPSALLEVKSTTKGFLPPRMTNAQRTAITSPAVGLMVYCTDATEGLYINKSTGWTFIA
jgi:hypothetical protein